MALWPLLVPFSATGQEADTGVVRQYLVEVIVFRHQGSDTSNGELWSPQFESPHAGSTAPSPADTSTPTVQYTELRHLAPSLLTIENDRRYAPLIYRAWLQTLSDKRNAPKIRLDVPGPYGAGLYGVKKALEGWVRVFENRLLFAEANLIARDSARPLIGGSRFSTPDQPVEFQLSEKRRVKLNELHYFDHPRIGMLVRVSRAETEVQETSRSR